MRYFMLSGGLFSRTALVAAAVLAGAACKKTASDAPDLQPSQPAPAFSPAQTIPMIAPGASASPSATAVAAASPMPSASGADQMRQLVLRYQLASEPDKRAELAGEITDLADEGVPAADVLRVLGSLLQTEPSADVKMEVIDQIATQEDPEVARQLVRAIGPSMPKEVRMSAIEMLADCEDQSVIPQLRQAMQDPDAEIAAAAREAVEALSQPPAP